MKAAVAAPSDSIDSSEEDDEEDVGALIYREVQLRKAEAAAPAAARRTASTTHHRTSTRKRTSPVATNKVKELPSSQRKSVSKRKRECSLEDDQPGRKEVVKKRRKYE